MRVPCATVALETTKSKPGTLQAEVVSTMAICGSIVTNLIATTSAVLVGSAVVSVLPEFTISPPTWILIIVSVFGSLGFGRFLYVKENKNK